MPIEIVGNFLTSGKIISRETASGKKFAVKDKKGKIRTSFDYDWIMPVLQSPTGILASKNHKLGTLNPKTFQPEIPFIYDQIGGFNATQDLVVAVKENRAGVITAKNQIVIPFDYYRIALNFKEIENFLERKFEEKGWLNKLSFSEVTFKRERKELQNILGIKIVYTRTNNTYHIENEELEAKVVQSKNFD